MMQTERFKKHCLDEDLKNLAQRKWPHSAKNLIRHLESQRDDLIAAIREAIELNNSHCECPTNAECAREADSWKCASCVLKDAIAEFKEESNK